MGSSWTITEPSQSAEISRTEQEVQSFNTNTWTECNSKVTYKTDLLQNTFTTPGLRNGTVGIHQTLVTPRKIQSFQFFDSSDDPFSMITLCKDPKMPII